MMVFASQARDDRLEIGDFRGGLRWAIPFLLDRSKAGREMVRPIWDAPKPRAATNAQGSHLNVRCAGKNPPRNAA